MLLTGCGGSSLLRSGALGMAKAMTKKTRSSETPAMTPIIPRSILERARPAAAAVAAGSAPPAPASSGFIPGLALADVVTAGVWSMQ
jgi:hypothetical protein